MFTIDFEVCVQDIAAYNDGALIFEWVALQGMTRKGLSEVINRVLARGFEYSRSQWPEGQEHFESEHEEWEVADVSTSLGRRFSDLNPFVLIDVFAGLEKHFETQEEVDCFLKWMIEVNAEFYKVDLDALVERFQENYSGTIEYFLGFEREAGYYFAEQNGVADLLTQNNLEFAFDYEAYGRTHLLEYHTFELGQVDSADHKHQLTQVALVLKD